ncbi:hypothetical protein BURPSS13_T0037 [Burkholderia pseudomallei S13]|nr:hypothetical protein BURPSS13_T0037 [Burkholderia pseudomallei S13]
MRSLQPVRSRHALPGFRRAASATHSAPRDRHGRARTPRTPTSHR